MTRSIVQETANREQVTAEIRARLGAWNASQASIADEENIVLKVEDEAGDLVAGAVGSLWGAVLELEFLWVADSERGAGLGSQLLGEMEETARARGCRTVITHTYSFQAPEFYRKRGYEIMNQVRGFPDGVTRDYFRKELVETQD